MNTHDLEKLKYSFFVRAVKFNMQERYAYQFRWKLPCHVKTEFNQVSDLNDRSTKECKMFLFLLFCFHFMRIHYFQYVFIVFYRAFLSEWQKLLYWWLSDTIKNVCQSNWKIKRQWAAFGPIYQYIWYISTE